LRHCAKDTLAASSEQIADDTRQLDLTFFEQTFQLALKPNLIGRQLIFGSGQPASDTMQHLHILLLDRTKRISGQLAASQIVAASCMSFSGV
jgi:hypothetical protein